ASSTPAAAPIVPAAAPSTAAAAQSAPPPASSTASKSEWDVQVAQVAVNTATINFEDRSVAPVFKLVLAPTHVTIDKVSLDMTRPLPVKMTTKIDGVASLTAAGDLAPDPLKASFDVDVRGFKLKPLQPYIGEKTDMTIRSGQADAKGRLELNPSGS